MSEVKRYDCGYDDSWCHDGFTGCKSEDNGKLVSYEDYAKLAVQLANAESKCRELAAELSAVDKIHNEAVFITDDHYEQCPPEVQKMIRSLAVLQIPAYQAFLAEVRAQGVEMYAEHLTRKAIASGENKNHAYAYLAANFAAKLRKGAAL